jgi:class 3 adenylate cyclase
VDASDWEAAGLYRPGAEGADDRLALLEYLSARGATLQQLVDAERLGALPAVASELVLARRPDTLSVPEVASRVGLPLETVARVFLAAGLPLAEDTRLPDGLDALLSAFAQGVALMGEDAILAFTRVLGAAATNVAEAAVALFYAELGPGTERVATTELARAHTSERATLAFTTIPEVLSRLVLAQFDRAVRRALVSRSWPGPAGEGTEPPVDAGPSEIVALGFVDLVGSTAWAEGMSLRDQSLALSRFESAAWSSAVSAGGRVVKMIGDEAFFAAPSADAACRIGIEVCDAVAGDPLLPPARGAVGHGAVTPREGDYFGPLVNLVSRLVKVADPGELVVTQEVADRLSADRWAVRELEPELLRGLEHPVRVFSVRPAADPST